MINYSLITITINLIKNLMESIEDQMLFVTFNQDASCFAVGTEKGFKIFNSFPFKDSFERSKK